MPGTGIWNSSGNVGIGTTGPASKLHVLDGDIRISTITSSRGVVFQDGSTQSAAAGLRITASGGPGDVPVSGDLTIEAKTGMYRMYVAQYLHYEGTAAYIMSVGGIWLDTTTNITSIDIFSNYANGIAAGSVISLYKMRR